MARPRSATWPPTSALYLAGTAAYREALSPIPNSTVGPCRRSGAAGAEALPERPQPCLRATAILIRAASVRLSIVLALTLAPVYHWFLSGGPPCGGRRGDGEGASVEEVQLKGPFQRGSMDQRKECLYCDWEMGRAGEKNGRPGEGAVCLAGLAGAPQLDPVSPEPIRAENNEAASADNLRSPQRNSERATNM